MLMMQYLNKNLSEYSLWDLGLIEKSLKDAEAQREAAKNHPKLIKRKIELPPPNPEFLKLKSAVEEEIRKRQK